MQSILYLIYKRSAIKKVKWIMLQLNFSESRINNYLEKYGPVFKF